MSGQTNGSSNDSGKNYTPESPDFSNARVETATVVIIEGPRFTAAEATQLSSSGTEAQNARGNIRNRSEYCISFFLRMQANDANGVASLEALKHSQVEILSSFSAVGDKSLQQRSEQIGFNGLSVSLTTLRLLLMFNVFEESSVTRPVIERQDALISSIDPTSSQLPVAVSNSIGKEQAYFTGSLRRCFVTGIVFLNKEL
ncbi:hypothetical protein E4U52_000839 [Claviceps spartinae]|nr:hypothetical protein E4U52_000839 [Claviceps spartinae]